MQNLQLPTLIFIFLIAGCDASDLAAGTSTPDASDSAATPNPGQPAVPTPLPVGDGYVFRDGVGTGTVGLGNLIVYGDEHVARSRQYRQPEIEIFWSNALNYLTQGRGGRIGWLAMGPAKDPQWGWLPALQFQSYLSQRLDPKYQLVDFNLATDHLEDFDAVVFLSYEVKFTPSQLKNYVTSGHGLMAMVIGLPGQPECADMNSFLAELPFYYDCTRTTQNLPAGHFLFDGLNERNLPYDNGYLVKQRP